MILDADRPKADSATGGQDDSRRMVGSTTSSADARRHDDEGAMRSATFDIIRKR